MSLTATSPTLPGMGVISEEREWKTRKKRIDPRLDALGWKLAKAGSASVLPHASRQEPIGEKGLAFRNLCPYFASMLRQIALPGCLFIAGCAAIQTEPLPASHSHGSLEAVSMMGELSIAYVLEGKCPNWNMALELARNKMGCAAGSTPPSRHCQELLPCNVCQFLQEGAWPEAVIEDFPGQAYYGRRPYILAAVLADKRWGVICPADDQTQVEFKTSLCFEKEILGRDRVELLAKAMVHEAFHLCQYVGGRGSTTVDKSVGDHLYCALLHGTYAPDAAGVTERCWESRE